MRQERCRFSPWVGKIPWRRKWQPTLVFLPGKCHGQRSLAGQSPWDCKQLDMTEVTEYAHTCLHSHHLHSTFNILIYLLCQISTQPLLLSIYWLSFFILDDFQPADISAFHLYRLKLKVINGVHFTHYPFIYILKIVPVIFIIRAISVQVLRFLIIL